MERLYGVRNVLNRTRTIVCRIISEVIACHNDVAYANTLGLSAKKTFIRQINSTTLAKKVIRIQSLAYK